MSRGEVMNKCLRITLWIQKIPKGFLKDAVQKHANTLKIEGTVQSMEEGVIKIVACGKKDTIDAFLDLLHKETLKVAVEDMQIEPFLKEKDYRGVFRVIE